MIGDDGLATEVKGGETRRHKNLKALGEDWLRRQGCRAVATEVRLPLSPYRVDVAGYRSVGRQGVLGESFALECKQSRSDFLRDASAEDSAQAERAELAREVESLRALLRVHLPECRAGRSLFCEFDDYDFGELRHEKWRRSLARLSLLERKLAEGVKFSRIARYGSANFLYLVIEEGVLLRLEEVPLGWGCLIREGEGLRLERAAKRLVSGDATKLAFLERIAARAAKQCPPAAARGDDSENN